MKPSFYSIPIFLIIILPITFCLPSPNITFIGDAHFMINTTSIFLTNQENSSFGGAFYSYPLRFLDSKTKSCLSFLTHFSFTITSVLGPSEGMSFLITSSLGSFNHESGHLGLPELSLPSHDSFFAVEFDTKFDPFVNDINGNHVGVDINSYSSLVSVDGFSSGINLSSGKRIYAWIEYNNLGKFVNVWISYHSERPKFPALSAHIDLSKNKREFMYVGFIASNGNVSALHVLDGWRFKTFESDFFYSSMIPAEETENIEDCMICFPKVSGNYSDKNYNLHRKKGGGKGLMTAIGVTIAIVVCFLVAIVGILTWKHMKGVKVRNSGLLSTIITKEDPEKLSLSDIKSATSGFSKSRIIGQGASSIVYKGIVGNDQIVAVKRFNQVSNVDILTPFTTEFSTMARCLRHKNLVQLLGWCCESNELILVYEFLPNGSLDQILYKNPVSLLTWEQRMNIVLGIASCLTYLHEECDRQIIHRDVKSCNVMLDFDFTPKLGDFGLAKVYDIGTHSNSHGRTLPAGTVGYLAPEYVYNGMPTVKSDVYSFGVVVLEVASGKRAVDENGTQIVDWAWALWEKGRLIEAIDGRLEGNYSRKDMERMLKVGLCCVHPDCEKRPTAKEAGMMLREEFKIPALPVKKPNLEIQSVLDDSPRRSIGCQVDEKSESQWSTPESHFGNE